jgi:hypothetical protein
MKKIWLFLSIVFVLNAQNPKLYSALGNVIYNNAPKISMLRSLDVYTNYKSKISQYIVDVTKTKTRGFALENSEDPLEGKAYLETLRALSKRNDFFVRSVDTNFHNALKNGNSKLFITLVNSGLLNTKKYKKEILQYYFKHTNELNTTGVIQNYLDEDAKLRAMREAQRKRYKTKKQKELERIQYLREKDKQEQEKLEKELDEKLRKKKLEIREYQQEELSKTI